MPDARCPICGSPPAGSPALTGPDRFHGTPGTFSIAVCSSCGTGWTLPPASSEELAAFYPPTYGFLTARRGVQQLLMDRAVSKPPFSALGSGGHLLDVGCGRGDLAAAFVRRGWRVSGVDLSADAVAAARAQGVDAHSGTLASVPLDRASFDAVVLRHSLEHLPDPLADLRRVLELLRPGGLVALSVPNFDSWERRRFGAAWFHLDLPRHRTHFVPRSLRLALETAGFDVVSVETGGDAGSLLATLQYRVAGRLFSRAAPAIYAQYAAGLALTPLRVALDRQEGGGPFLHAVARRPPLA